MTGLIILGALIVIVVWIMVGKEFQHIAEMKGHPGSKYFWWCFLLSVVGWAMVIALPDRRSAQDDAVGQVISDELPEL